VLLLDENITVPAAKQLRRWRIPVRSITDHCAARGTADADLVPILHRLAQPTFFTHDWDFWAPELCHPGYCIVHLAMEDTEAADYIRRFLGHPKFDTIAKRLGKVVQARQTGLFVYGSRHGKAETLDW
jgi:hypothetical protein